MRVRKFWLWCTEETTKQSKGLFYAREGDLKPNVKWALDEFQVIEMEAYNEVVRRLLTAREILRENGLLDETIT